MQKCTKMMYISCVALSNMQMHAACLKNVQLLLFISVNLLVYHNFC